MNYSSLIKKQWIYFENSAIMGLRLLDRLNVNEISVVGFDGYDSYNYSDNSLIENIGEGEKDILNNDILEMIMDFEVETGRKIKFLTKSIFRNEKDKE